MIMMLAASAAFVPPLGADVPACVESTVCIGTGTGTDELMRGAAALVVFVQRQQWLFDAEMAQMVQTVLAEGAVEEREHDRLVGERQPLRARFDAATGGVERGSGVLRMRSTSVFISVTFW